MPQSILIVDDSELIHTLVRARLAGEPVDFISAASGEEAIKLANDKLPDLILLDVDMPEMNGFEVCRQLKSEPITMPIPVIFLTGASTTAEKIQGLELGAVDYVTKPFDPAELRARVRASLRTKYLLDLLSKKAMIDGLTGLWNRAFFDQRLAQELSLATRVGRAVSLIMLDVDHFKHVNDSYGHPFGDEVLRLLSQTLAEQCRLEDIICRYGGEEFAVITPGVSLIGAESLAERIRSAFAARGIRRCDQVIHVSASFGVADTHASGTLTMVEAADRALYRAKTAGRNRVMLAEESLLPLRPAV